MTARDELIEVMARGLTCQNCASAANEPCFRWTDYDKRGVRRWREIEHLHAERLISARGALDALEAKYGEVLVEHYSPEIGHTYDELPDIPGASWLTRLHSVGRLTTPTNVAR